MDTMKVLISREHDIVDNDDDGMIYSMILTNKDGKTFHDLLISKTHAISLRDALITLTTETPRIM